MNDPYFIRCYYEKTDLMLLREMGNLSQEQRSQPLPDAYWEAEKKIKERYIKEEEDFKRRHTMSYEDYHKPFTIEENDMKFVKLYEDTKYGQILVRLDENEEGNVEVKYTAYMSCLGMGLCSIAPVFEGEDMWEKAEKSFERVTLENAIDVISTIEKMSEGA